MTHGKFKVDFFCVGVAKGGTTTLHDLLRLQSNISLPVRKETNYFSFGISGAPEFTGPLDDSSVNRQTITSFEEYVNDFENWSNSTIGEVCPSYSLEGAAENIYEHNPNAKIIIILRNPVKRAYSNYQHLVRDGREYGSFESALDKESDRLEKGWEWFWALKRNSMYSNLVRKYFDLFGKENVKIIFFEHFIENQEEHLKDVMQFIGINPNASKYVEHRSNISGVVSDRWKNLHRLLLSEGKVNSILRTLLPSASRKKLGAMFKSLSTNKGNIAPSTSEKLLEEFSEDLGQLVKLLDEKAIPWFGNKSVS